MFNTEISILLNIEKIPILKFNITESLGISTKNTEMSDELNFEGKKFEKIKKKKNFQNFQYSWIFSVFFSIFRDSIPKMFDIEKKF